jgi:hypothetical protein
MIRYFVLQNDEVDLRRQDSLLRIAVDKSSTASHVQFCGSWTCGKHKPAFLVDGLWKRQSTPGVGRFGGDMKKGGGSPDTRTMR